MATKKIELSKVERKYHMPTLRDMQEIDKNIKKVLHVEVTGDMFIVEVEVASAPKKKAAPKAEPKVESKAKLKAKKKSLIGSDSDSE